ncbi:MAG: hypothetical protein JWL83_1155 [Actinomycetia bacterium]|nr:hypothetical protein [Actinomycetes bacterium]
MALVLAQFDNGVGAVSVSTRHRIWTDRDAVAAPDGSAVFSVRHSGGSTLVRINKRTGAVTSSWPLRPGLWVSAVAPGGQWVALTDHRGAYVRAQQSATTEIVVVDTRVGRESHRVVLTGDVRPEAFSLDGKRIFALDYRGDHYRVQTIEVATGERYDTNDRDKTVTPEDMRGAAVRGVLSADRTLLATLYRNPGNTKEPAFVHVLDLEYAWSYCADLPRPFGTGPVGSDVIELTRNNTVVVANASSARIAEIHIDAVHTPGDTPVPVAFRGGTLTSTVASYRGITGFAHVIATFPA